jgi:DNA-binding transcriptional MerR regulator|tara:strand:+ start:110 stop:511 length:402 start_codon:yes stop_codon:yes gene_type:complete
MEDNKKEIGAYKTIGEVAKEIGLIDKKTGSLKTHTLRYWESEFRQIKPTIKAGNRRYYSEKDLKIIKKIQTLLKEKGLTIKGVKKLLNDSKIDTLDENRNLGIFNDNNLKKTEIIKDKLKKISKIITELKKIK